MTDHRETLDPEVKGEASKVVRAVLKAGVIGGVFTVALLLVGEIVPLRPTPAWVTN